MYAELSWKWWKDAQPVPRFMLLSTTALFISLTIFAGVSLEFVYDGFVTYGETMATSLYFGQVTAWQEIVANVLLEFNTALAEGILIYRCWLIWDQNKLIGIFTLVLYAGFVVVSGFNLATPFSANSPDLLGYLFQQYASTWMRTYLSYTLGQSTLVYGLIIYRIWHTSRKVSRLSTSSMSPVIMRLVGVGLCYIMVLAIWLVTNVLGSSAYLILVYAWIPFVGIVFLALTVRSSSGTSSSQTSTLPRVAYGTERQPRKAAAHIALTPIRISVTQREEADAESGMYADGKQDSNDRASSFSVHAL